MTHKESKPQDNNERKLNLLLIIPMYIWILNNITKAISSTVAIPLYIEYAEGVEKLACIDPLMRLGIIISLILILNLKKSGAYMYILIMLLYLVANTIVAGFVLALVSLSVSGVFVILFFTLKRNGKTAFQVIFDK